MPRRAGFDDLRREGGGRYHLSILSARRDLAETPFPDAQRLVVAACAATSPEDVALEASVGRVLANDIVAREAFVPFARSAMDGYAVAVEDLASLPATLPVAARVYAERGSSIHARGTATAIATGAPLPSGANAVIPIEDVILAGGAIRVRDSLRLGASVFPPGEDACAGETLAVRGTAVSAGALALLAAAGCERVAVFRRPVVTVVCSGDELVPVDVRPAHGQIRNSNGPMLASALAAAGALVREVVTVPDDPSKLRAVLHRALDAGDLVVTTGGASAGEHDYVKDVAASIGVAFAFRLVGLRPAKPTAFGRRGTRLLAVLPGNPAAAFVALHEFVLPAVRTMAGCRDPFAPRLSVTLDGVLAAKPVRHLAAFAQLFVTGSGFIARPLANQCSSLTRTAADACGFIVVPPGTQTYRCGDRVAFDVVDWAKARLPQETRA